MLCTTIGWRSCRQKYFEPFDSLASLFSQTLIHQPGSLKLVFFRLSPETWQVYSYTCRSLDYLIYMCLGFRRLGHSWVVLILKVACNISLSMVHFVSTTEVGLEGYFCIHIVWLCVYNYMKSTLDPDHPHYVCTYHWSIWMETTRKGDKIHKVK